jgi:hypothetical protein
MGALDELVGATPEQSPKPSALAGLLVDGNPLLDTSKDKDPTPPEVYAAKRQELAKNNQFQMEAESYGASPGAAILRMLVGAGRAVTGTVAGLGNLAQAAQNNLPILPAETSAGLAALTGLGQGAQAVENKLPTPAPGALGALEEGAGQLGVLAATGAGGTAMASRVLGRELTTAELFKLGMATSAPQGVALGAHELHDDAASAGATPQEIDAATALGGLVGTTDAIPVGRFVRDLNRATKGRLLRKIAELGLEKEPSTVAQVVKGFLTEGGQEGGQEILNNLIAKDVVGYDPTRTLGENFWLSAITGGLLGSAFGAGIDAVHKSNRDEVLREMDAKFEQDRFDPINQIEGPFTPTADIQPLNTEMGALRDLISTRAQDHTNDLISKYNDSNIVPEDPLQEGIPTDAFGGYKGAQHMIAGQENPQSYYTHLSRLPVDTRVDPELIDEKTLRPLSIQEALNTRNVVAEASMTYAEQISALQDNIKNLKAQSDIMRSSLDKGNLSAAEASQVRKTLAETAQTNLFALEQLNEFKQKESITLTALKAAKEYVTAFQAIYGPDLKVVLRDSPDLPGKSGNKDHLGFMALSRDVPFADGTRHPVATVFLKLDKLAADIRAGIQSPTSSVVNETKRRVWEVLNHELGHAIHINAKQKILAAIAGAKQEGNPDRTWNTDLLNALQADHQDFLQAVTGMTKEEVIQNLAPPQSALGTVQHMRNEGMAQQSAFGPMDRGSNPMDYKRYLLSIDEYMADAVARLASQGKLGTPVLDQFFGPALQEYDKVFKQLPPTAQNTFGGSTEAWLRHEALAYRKELLIQGSKQKTVYNAMRGLVKGFDPSKFVGMKEWHDRWSWGMKVGLNLTQMVKENPHIQQLQRYMNAVENWNAYRRSIAADTVEAIEMWRNLGKVQAAQLSEIFVEEMDAKKLLSPAALAAKTGGNPEVLQVYMRIRAQLNKILDEMKTVVIDQTKNLYIGREEQLVEELAKIEREFKNMKKSGYFPAVRFGNYTITIKEGPRDLNKPQRTTLNEAQLSAIEGNIKPIEREDRTLENLTQKMNQGYKLYSYNEDFEDMMEIHDPTILFDEIGNPTPEAALGDLYLSNKRNKDFYLPGQVVSFTAYETEADRNQALQQLKEKHGPQRLYSVGVMREMEYVIQGMPRSMLVALKDKLKATGGLDENMEKVVDDAIAGASAYKDFRKHMLRKKGIDGYSEDLLRSFSHYMQAGAGHLARVKYADAVREPIANLQEDVSVLREAGRYTAARQNIQKWLQNHMLYIMNPENELAALRGVGFVAFMGYNVKSAMVNLMQPIQVGLPYLSARYGDGKSIAEMTKATWQVKDWFAKREKYVAEAKAATGSRLDRHTRLYAQGQHEGWIDQSLAMELAIAANEDNLKRGWVSLSRGQRFWYHASRYGAMPFHIAEKFNRLLIATTAYNLEYDRTQDHARAVQAAKIANYSVNFENSRWNRPEFMRGKKSVALLFVNYLQNTLYFATHDKGAMRFALMMLLLAGVMGLPGAEDAEDLVSFAATSMNTLLGIKNPQVDLERELREAMLEISANPDLILHGISQNSFGLGQLGEMMGLPIPRFDVSGSLGVGNIIPGTELLSRYGNAPSAGDIAVSAAGASGNLVQDFYTALMSNSPDDWKRMEKLVPLMALRNVSKSVRFAERGGEFTAAGEKIATFSAFDPRDRMELIGQALGFTPTKLAKGWEAYMAEKEAVNYYKAASSELQRQINWAFLQEDREAMADVRKKVSEYNMSVPYPEMRMRPEDIRSSLKSYLRQQAMAKAGIDSKKYRRLEKSIEEVYSGPASSTPGMGQ